MKEATGEANMTIVTVVLIAAVVAIATPLITNAIRANRLKVNCLNRGCYWHGGTCYQSHTGTDENSGYSGTCSTADVE